ncbi:hypothetical protein M422DRAFT_28826 [Sphaerobolus stellatus SS14]|nr:hypothetical protein M422DRAFT_28826 [Sphaerobolus stellatus SS14]
MALPTAVRTAIVTGAARGIGRAISLRLARDGLNVVAADLPFRRTELEKLAKEIRDTGRTKAVALCTDVSKESEVKRLVDSTVEEFGALDVMVANAGICPSSPLTLTSVEEWEKVMGINAGGVFLCYKTAAIQMIKQGRGGRMLAASSVAGKQGLVEMTSYAASKFAVRALTQVAAKELWQHGITVNAYAPGGVVTELMTDLVKDRKARGLPDVSLGAYIDESQIMQPEHVATLVSYLIKEESRYITGQTINMNAGWVCD